jgi:hypothetical protein
VEKCYQSSAHWNQPQNHYDQHRSDNAEHWTSVGGDRKNREEHDDRAEFDGDRGYGAAPVRTKR